MLLDVITRVAEDAGYDLVQQRDKLLRIANKAARELYQELDCNRIRREVSCLVGANKYIALPSQIGELRGMRQHTADWPVPLVPMAPRFVNDTQGYKWNNWRDLGISPFHTTPVSVDVLTFTSVLIEDAIVTISGRTNVAARESEDVTINLSPQQTTKLFYPDVKSISSKSVRNCDIVVLDADGNEVATLYNNEKQTRYKLVDVSELFLGTDTSDGQTLVDVLYKEPLYEMTLDTDEFPGGSIYDNAWISMMMSVHYSSMPNRNEDFKKNRSLAMVQLRSVKDGSEVGIIKKVEFGRNKYYDNTSPCYDRGLMMPWNR